MSECVDLPGFAFWTGLWCWACIKAWRSGTPKEVIEPAKGEEG